MQQLRRTIGIVLSLAILALPLLFWWQYQALADWWKLRGYVPPASISELALATKMSDTARHIFFVNHPELIGQIETFRQKCPINEQTIVLGCYRSNQSGIAIYGVKDQRLQGVEEVTAAHEMLHAAYDRLSGDEKERVNALLSDYYQNGLSNPRIKNLVDSYKKTSPGDLINEMHSIFGTEIAVLPPGLEEYYSQYFIDQDVVANFAAGYEKEFSSRLAQIEDYDRQLSILKEEIDEQEAELAKLQSQIESDRVKLDSLRGSGQIEQYNSQVSPFNAKVRAYNQRVVKLKSDISDFNELVAKRNEVASELRSLDSALDTRLTTQAAQ